ncbi:hypothetical protein GDO81_018314 [Engystomops pustulosus]|uniref:Uncharacterized protein n=1 Tax=Engystomops pustulosus TaxID=76066 RepID=A0AAV7ACJ2_ENGPU|nr:hypothetical protein GDO81_018314 [Engystomops pustulosus]
MGSASSEVAALNYREKPKVLNSPVEQKPPCRASGASINIWLFETIESWLPARFLGKSIGVFFYYDMNT